MGKIYGVDFRNFNTAIHGLIIYNKWKDAEEGYKKLQNIEHEAELGIIDDSFIYELRIEEVINDADDFIEEINFRKIKDNKIELGDGSVVYIVNNIAVDLYF